jgi:hypothetical protein
MLISIAKNAGIEVNAVSFICDICELTNYLMFDDPESSRLCDCRDWESILQPLNKNHIADGEVFKAYA